MPDPAESCLEVEIANTGMVYYGRGAGSAAPAVQCSTAEEPRRKPYSGTPGSLKSYYGNMAAVRRLNRWRDEETST